MAYIYDNTHGSNFGGAGGSPFGDARSTQIGMMGLNHWGC